MPRVRFLNDDLEIEIPPGSNLSLAAAQAEASLPFGCRAGTCGTCALTVEEGLAALEPMGFVEEDTLRVTGAFGPRRRLGCQIILGETDVAVSWD